MNRLLCATMIVLLAMLNAAPAVACTCAPAPPGTTPRDIAQGHRDHSDAIFEGKVVRLALQSRLLDARIGEVLSADLEDEFPNVLVTLQVTRPYRGAEQKTVQLVTGLGGGDCGYIFRTDEEYLVYAYKDASGRLSTSICSGTGLLATRGSDLAYLRGEPEPEISAGDRKPTPTATGEVCGRIATPSPRGSGPSDVLLLESPPKAALPFADGPVEVGEDNTFCIRNVDAGNYHLLYRQGPEEALSGFAYYPGVTKEADAATIEVKQGSKVEVALRVDPQVIYEVAGHVTLRGTGALPESTKVFLVSVEQPFMTLFYAQDVGPGGFFAVPHVISGKYWVTIGVEADEATKWFTKKVSLDVEGDVTNLDLTIFTR